MNNYKQISIKNVLLFSRSLIKVFFLKVLYFKKFQFNSIFTIYIGKGSSLIFSNRTSRFLVKSIKVRKNVFINLNGGTMEIGNDVFFNNGCSINCHKSIKIGDNTIFGENVLIYDHDHKFNLNDDLVRKLGFISQEVIIGSNVWVGSNVVILKGVTIGENSVIAAGSIVTKNIPKNTLFYQSRISLLKTL